MATTTTEAFEGPRAASELLSSSALKVSVSKDALQCEGSTVSPLLSPTSVAAVRSSRRVQRKKEERKESEGEESMLGSPVPQPPIPSATKLGSVASVPVASTSNGSTTSSVTLKSCEERLYAGEDASLPSSLGGRRRVWEQWSSKDKDTFFEAVGESGKNFEAIQRVFQARHRRRGQVLLKNKEQIRTFYYRSWHKIAKHLSFPDSMKKNSRELYGLINYGEMRKRLGEDCLDENRGAKLQELVFSGYTTVRLKGKTCRIKTPVCRALERLKKSSSGGQSDSCLKLPDTICLQLKPQSGRDFAFVHRQCFQNPFLTIKIDLKVRLQDVIQMLETKWRSCMYTTSITLHVPDDVELRRPLIQCVEPLTSAKLSVSQLNNELKSDGECEECCVEDDINYALRSTESVEDKKYFESGSEDTSIRAADLAAVTTSTISASTVEVESKVNYGELKRCWMESSAGCLTVGELLLMSTSSKKEKNEGMTLLYSIDANTDEETLDSRKLLSALSNLAQRECQRHKPNSNPEEIKTSSPSPSDALATSECSKKSSVTESSMSSQSTLTTFVFPTPYASSNVSSGSKLYPLMPKSGQPSAQNSEQVEAFCRQLRELRKGRKGGRPPNRRSIVSRRLLPVNPQPILPTLKMPIPPKPNMCVSSGSTTRSPAIIPQKLLGVNIASMPTNSTNSGANAAVSEIANNMNESSIVSSKSDRFLDSVLETSNSSSNALLQVKKDTSPSTPPSSPFRVVGASEEWLPDLSLSSLLGLSTEQSPSKTVSRSVLTTPHHLLNEDSVQSTGSEVDRQLLAMLNTENSVDFTMKFAKLAAHVNDNDC